MPEEKQAGRMQKVKKAVAPNQTAAFPIPRHLKNPITPAR
jgi:hypothetical protein